MLQAMLNAGQADPVTVDGWIARIGAGAAVVAAIGTCAAAYYTYMAIKLALKQSEDAARAAARPGLVKRARSAMAKAKAGGFWDPSHMKFDAQRLDLLGFACGQIDPILARPVTAISGACRLFETTAVSGLSQKSLGILRRTSEVAVYDLVRWLGTEIEVMNPSDFDMPDMAKLQQMVDVVSDRRRDPHLVDAAEVDRRIQAISLGQTNP